MSGCRVERRESAVERMSLAQQTLAAQVAALQSGEQWQQYLALQARFHCYSPNNALLIAAQHHRAFLDGAVKAADPSWVAGFNTWKALGRSVDRGQHGYMVLAPCRYDRRVAVDGEGSARRLGRGDRPVEGERVESRRVAAGFRVEYVFDVSQTSGADLAERPCPTLVEGEAPAGLGTAVVALIEGRGFSVDTVAGADVIGGANGLTRWDDKTVLVRADMDDAAMVKTLIHEAGHVLLHGDAPGRFLPRAVKEVEAESVAFVVAAAHGMATDSYSFPYVAAWAGEGGARVVQATQARVAEAARTVIDASPAARLDGGRPPGADLVASSAAARRAGRSTTVVGGDRAASADLAEGVEYGQVGL